MSDEQHIEKLDELTKIESKAWKRYEDSKHNGDARNPRFINDVLKCINERAKFLDFRAKRISDELKSS